MERDARNVLVALDTYFGKPVRPSFTVGTLSGLTPAALQQRAEEQKQADAIAAIEQDPVAQELIEQFDAKFIKPIEK
jgi:DNA polymerase-3 subunit gamma/tau